MVTKNAAEQIELQEEIKELQMNKKYKAVVFTSPINPYKAEIRYVIKDMESGEIVDDAQGYGYKSAQKAYAGWAYKNRDKSRDSEKAEKERMISKWMTYMQLQRSISRKESLPYGNCATDTGCLSYPFPHRSLKERRENSVHLLLSGKRQAWIMYASGPLFWPQDQKRRLYRKNVHKTE